MSLRSFDQAWSSEDSRLFQESLKDLSADREERQKHRARLEIAFREHLEQVVTSGQMPMPPHSDHVDVPWVNALRRLNAGQPTKWDMQTLSQYLVNGVLSGLYGDTKKSSEEFHSTLVSTVKAGNFEAWFLPNQMCMNSGLRLAGDFVAWRPTLQRFDFSSDATDSSYTPIAPEEIAPPGIHHATVTFPTGEVLVHDWFRFQEFAQKMATLDSEDPDINTIQGCVNRTLAYAAANVVSVSVGNSSPDVYRVGDAVCIGRASDLDETRIPANAANQVGHVTTDLWWVTMVDRETLLNILETGRTRAAAEQALEEWLAGDGYSTTRLRLEPGIHHVYFSGARRYFKPCAQFNELDLSDWEEPMFVVSKNFLTPPLAPATTPSSRKAKPLPCPRPSRH